MKNNYRAYLYKGYLDDKDSYNDAARELMEQMLNNGCENLDICTFVLEKYLWMKMHDDTDNDFYKIVSEIVESFINLEIKIEDED